MKRKDNQTSFMHVGLIRATRAEFIFILAIVLQIILFDASKLITPQAVLQRWVATALLLLVTTIVWYLARTRPRANSTYRNLVLILVLANVAFASFAVYTQRGMASRAVVLYLVPIIISGILASRTAIFGTAALCIAAYTTTAVSYFVLNFNEGYKVELYGEVGFYCAMFLVCASLVWMLVRSKKKI